MRRAQYAWYLTSQPGNQCTRSKIGDSWLDSTWEPLENKVKAPEIEANELGEQLVLSQKEMDYMIKEASAEFEQIEEHTPSLTKEEESKTEEVKRGKITLEQSQTTK